MPELVVILRTHSDAEASIVRGLLESHGIQVLLSSAVPHSVFPLTIDGLGEVRLSVRADEAEEATRIIEGYRTETVGGRVVPFGQEIPALERRIDYRFRDRALLEQALTHTSRANEEGLGPGADNESLEFLGDAILGFLVADTLFRDFPEYSEGGKSKIKAALVSTPALARAAERIGLGRHLRLGRGEEKTGGRQKPALLADAFEALLAAIYLDGGVEQARAFIEQEFKEALAEVRRPGFLAQDYKSALQEFLQSRDRPLPEYRHLGAAGPDHRKRFDVEVRLEGEAVAQATGGSKKEAEQEAARLALLRLDGPTPPEETP
ncbi:MAG TPA: ribonuclease III [Vicinamibacterales bacterium]|nr:ribonuclease III [Vicinamibacterales bacterium]